MFFVNTSDLDSSFFNVNSGDFTSQTEYGRAPDFPGVYKSSNLFAFLEWSKQALLPMLVERYGVNLKVEKIAKINRVSDRNTDLHCDGLFHGAVLFANLSIGLDQNINYGTLVHNEPGNAVLGTQVHCMDRQEITEKFSQPPPRNAVVFNPDREPHAAPFASGLVYRAQIQATDKKSVIPYIA